MEDTPTPSRTSERFCAADADVNFRSSDGVLISIHRKYLEANTGGFPPGEFDTLGEVVPLLETSTTLELLFQFIYPQKHPDLKSTEIGVLAPLAEAAEKYEVYSAMNVCEIRMWNLVYSHPPEVLAYAAKHGHMEIVNVVAPLAVALPLQDVVMILPQNMVIPWVRYSEQWTKVLLVAVKETAQCGCRSASSGSSYYCQSCGSYSNQGTGTWVEHSPRIFAALGGGIGSLRSIDGIFAHCSVSCKSCCKAVFETWRQRVNAEILLVKEFQTFL